jgi:cell pole-organizing protein PopZ
MVMEDGGVVNITAVDSHETKADEIEFEPVVSAESLIDEMFSSSVADAAPLDDIMKNIDDAIMQPQESPVVAAPLPPPPTTTTMAHHFEEDTDSLLSQATMAAASQALKSLKRPNTTPPVPNDVMVFRSGTTIEDLVVESLKPLLKSWLDDNLPQMVERMVEREIQKLS